MGSKEHSSTKVRRTAHHEYESAPSENMVDVGKAKEDRMTFRDAFNWRVSLSVLFLITSYMSAVGALIFLSILILPYQATFGTSSVINWVPISHITVATCIFTLSGRWSDLLGRRWFFIVADILAAVGCIIGATASSVNALIACGVITGAATGTQQIAAAAIQELFPNHYKPYAMGIFGVGTLPMQFAPLIAGSFINNYRISWRGCWWVVSATNMFGAIGLFLVYCPPTGAQMNKTGAEKPLREELAGFDWVGYGFLAAAVVPFLVGLNFGGNPYPWNSAAVIAPIVIGIVFLVVFCIWEKYSNVKIPLIDAELMTYTRSFIMPTICIAASAMGYYALNILWPQVIAVFFTTNSASQSYYQMAIAGGLIVGGFSYGPCSKMIKHYKYQIIAVATIQTAFTAALAATNVGTEVMSCAFVAISSFCLSWLTLNAQLAMVVALPPRLLGSAFGLAGAFRLAIGTVATTVYVVILTNVVSQQLPVRVSAAAIGAGLPESALPALFTAIATGTSAAFAKVPGITEAIILAVSKATNSAYSVAFTKVFLVSLAFSGSGLICAFFIKNFNTQNTANHVEVGRHEKAEVMKA